MSTLIHSPAAMLAARADAIAAVKMYARLTGLHYRKLEEQEDSPALREAHVEMLAAEAALLMLRADREPGAREVLRQIIGGGRTWGRR